MGKKEIGDEFYLNICGDGTEQVKTSRVRYGTIRYYAMR